MTESGHKVVQNCDIIETEKVNDGEFFQKRLIENVMRETVSRMHSNVEYRYPSQSDAIINTAPNCPGSSFHSVLRPARDEREP
jgi:hypothetical protein